jgi:hypothetical protein
MALGEGLEPPTIALTVQRSAIELPKNLYKIGWDERARTSSDRSRKIQNLLGLPIFLRPKTYVFVKPALQNPQGQPTA